MVKFPLRWKTLFFFIINWLIVFYYCIAVWRQLVITPVDFCFSFLGALGNNETLMDAVVGPE